VPVKGQTEEKRATGQTRNPQSAVKFHLTGLGLIVLIINELTGFKGVGVSPVDTEAGLNCLDN
jgi:hypothetical protein